MAPSLSYSELHVTYPLVFEDYIIFSIKLLDPHFKQVQGAQDLARLNLGSFSLVSRFLVKYLLDGEFALCFFEQSV